MPQKAHLRCRLQEPRRRFADALAQRRLTKRRREVRRGEVFGQFQGEVRLCPGPMGVDFWGSRVVASRNTLLGDGATNATWWGLFDLGTVPPCRSGVPGAGLGGSLATPNFGEFPFPRTRMNRPLLEAPGTPTPTSSRCHLQPFADTRQTP